MQFPPGLGSRHRRAHLRRVYIHVGICVREYNTPWAPSSLGSALGFGADVNTWIAFPYFESKGILLADMSILVSAGGSVIAQEIIEVVNPANINDPLQLVFEHSLANLQVSE